MNCQSGRTGRGQRTPCKEIDKRCDRMMEHVDDYDEADNLETYLNQIKSIAADLTHNALVTSNQQFLSNDDQ